MCNFGQLLQIALSPENWTKSGLQSRKLDKGPITVQDSGRAETGQIVRVKVLEGDVLRKY